MYYWIGLREDGNWEVFTTDKRSEGTPEETGYDEVEGPYYSLAEAEAAIDTTAY